MSQHMQQAEGVGGIFGAQVRIGDLADLCIDVLDGCFGVVDDAA